MRKLVLLVPGMLFLCLSILAQKTTIIGKVTDEKGITIPGATITIKGTKTGVSADNQGVFSISISPGAKLIVSAAGFKEKEVAATNNTVVALALEDRTMSEVIVTAQGIRRRPKELGYSAAKISSEDIMVGRSPQLAASLSGKVSGLAVYNVNNSVDPSVKINLRGFRSMTGNNDALIVIDGVPLPRESSSSNLATLNPNDVESVTILKGGVAATLYGSEGVNGAVVVTTKKGVRGRTKVTFSNSTNVEEVSFYAKFQDQYGSGSHYAASFGAAGYKPNYLDRMHDNWRPFENQQYGDAYNGEMRIIGRVLEDGSSLIIPYAPIKNVRKDLWNHGFTTNNQVAISGGTEQSTFYLSAENNITHGIVPNDESDRTGLRFSATTESGRFKASFNGAYVKADYDRTTFDFYNESINQAAHIPIMRDWQTNKFANPNGYYNDYYNNPFFRIDNYRTKYNDANFSGQIELNYKVTNWLSITERVSELNNNRTTKNTVGKFIHSSWAKSGAYVPAPWQWANDYNGINRALTDIQGSVYDANYTENVFNNDIQGLFNKSYGNFVTKGLVGFSMYRRKTKLVEVSSSSIVVPDVYNVVNRQGELGGGESFSEYRKYGYYADITQGWKNMIFLNGLFRLDGSSKFYANNRSTDLFQIPYYGGDLAVVLTEVFPQLSTNVMNYAKLRIGYNLNGNDNIPIYGLDLSYANAAGFPYGSTVGISVGNTLPDANLKPEKVKSFEVGGEFQLLKSRITLDLSYYKQRSDGQVINVTIPASTGFTGLRLNVGDTKNWGYEADLKAQIIKGTKLNWDFNVRYSYNENKAISLANGVNELLLAGYSYASSYVIKGSPFPIMKAISYVRDPATNRVIVNATTGYPITNGPLKNFGRTTPKHIMGAGTRVNYAAFTLLTNWEYRGGNVMYSDLGRQMTFTGSGGWTVDRSPHVFPNSSYDDGTGKFVENTSLNVREAEYSLWVDYYRLIAENFVFPAWFIKLRDINLTYEVPNKLLSKTKVFGGATIGLYGRNLFMIVDKLNYYTDPEFSFTTGNGLGVSNTAQTPPTRQYGFNINLMFR